MKVLVEYFEIVISGGVGIFQVIYKNEMGEEQVNLVPTFGFDKDGNVLPRRAFMDYAPIKQEWLDKYILAEANSYYNSIKKGYVEVDVIDDMSRWEMIPRTKQVPITNKVDCIFVSVFKVKKVDDFNEVGIFATSSKCSVPQFSIKSDITRTETLSIDETSGQ